MEIGQYFDTTMTDCDSGRAARVIAIPSTSIPPHLRPGMVDTTQVLSLQSLAWLESRAEFVRVLASLLGMNGDRSFAEACAVEPRVPLGEGGPHLASLLAIAESHGRIGESVRLTSFGASRQILVAVAVGVVVIGEAHSLSTALGAGLGPRLRELMGMDGEQYAWTGPSVVAT